MSTRKTTQADYLKELYDHAGGNPKQLITAAIIGMLLPFDSEEANEILTAVKDAINPKDKPPTELPF